MPRWLGDPGYGYVPGPASASAAASAGARARLSKGTKAKNNRSGHPFGPVFFWARERSCGIGYVRSIQVKIAVSGWRRTA